MAEDKEKKIIIDEDWKSQAQKEKEKLAEQEKAERETKAKEKSERPNLPPASLEGLITMLATQSFFALGVLRAEEDEEVEPDLELAKFNIDMLEVLSEKTKGNLSDNEQKMLEHALHQLRMAFVQVSK